MPPRNDNLDGREDLNVHAEPDETGKFTPAFGEREVSPSNSSSQPGSLTQALGGSSKPSQSEEEKPPQVARTFPKSSASAESFTSAFKGVNAFTRDLGDPPEDPFKTESGRKPRMNSVSPPSSGTFTRIFGAGEGVLTPAGPGDDSFPKPSLPKAPMVKDTNFSAPNSATEQRGSFTEAFHTQPPPDPIGTNRNGGSFTDQFGSPSAPEPPTPRYSPPGRQDDISPPGDPERAIPNGGFTRLVGSYDSDITPLPDVTRRSTPVAHVSQRPLADPNFGSPATSSLPNATIAFNPRRSETEFTPPQGKSEYTRVVDSSKFRQPRDPYGTASAPPPAAAPPLPPAVVQYPLAPQTPAWPPAPAVPTPQVSGHPQMATPTIPQPPAAPQLGAFPNPPTAGDRLIQFLPLILTLSVVNTLGLLAVLIILFATRK